MSGHKLSKPAATWLAILGAIILVMAAFLTFYGWQLVSLHGSAYFLIAGVALLISGVQIIRQRVSGALLYGVVLLGTAIWALWDVGLDFWPLVSRLLTLAGFGILVALSLPLLLKKAGKMSGWKPTAS